MLEHTPGGRRLCLLVFLIVGICVCLWSSAAFAASTTGVASATGEHTQEEWVALRESPKVPQVTLPEANGEHGETSKVTSPEAPAAGETGVDGLNPGEAVPKWANHALVHFYPPLPRTSAASAVRSAASKAMKNAALKAKPLIAGTGSQRLTYHAGYVQREAHLYLLFWGSNFWEGENPAGLGGELEFFFRGLEKESIVNPAWQGILSQYWSYGGEAYKHAKVMAEAKVSAVVAPTKVTNAKIEEEIGYWIEDGASVTPNTQFVVMLAPHSTFEKGQLAGCAYHSVASHDGHEYVYDVIPYAGDANKYYGYSSACNRLERLKTTEAEELIHSTTGAASHEFAEAITDPLIWIGEYPYTKRFSWVENESKGGETEIADLCIDEEEAKKEYAIEELPAKNGRVGWTYVNKLWDDEGGNKCKLEDPPYSESGTNPSVATLSNGNYTLAAQTSTNELWAITGAPGAETWTGRNLGFGMRGNSSPSIAVLPNGNYVLAVQARNGELWTITGTPGGETWTGRNVKFGTMPGTSPSIAALSNGSYDIAVQATNGELWSITGTPTGETWTGRNLGFEMRGNSSPSIAILPNGNFEIAAQESGGGLWAITGTPGGETWTGRNVKFGTMPGASPSIAALSSGSYDIAVQESSGSLWSITGTPLGETWTGRNMSFGMNDSSPSIVVLPNGNYEIGAQASSGELWTITGTPGAETWTGRDMAFGMNGGSSPSVAALPNGHYELGAQASNGGLWTLTGTPGAETWTGRNMGFGM